MPIIDISSLPLLLANAQIGVDDPPGLPWLRIIVALVFCLSVAVGAILAIKAYHSRGFSIPSISKLTGGAQKKEIEIIETRRASDQGQLCLFHYAGSAYLIVITSGGATLLDKLPVLGEPKS